MIEVSSENSTQGSDDGQICIDPGTQALVSITSMEQPFSLLPANVSGNVLIVSSSAPASVEELLREQGIDVSTAGLIPITGSEIDYDGPLWTSKPALPDDLTGVSMRYTRALNALEPGHGWVLFDSLNALLMYAQRDRVCRFFDHVTSKTRDRDLHGIYTVASDALDDEAYNSFKRSVDRVVDSR